METNKRIFSAGPFITEKEVEYVLDAVKNGWYSHYQDYKIKFEQEFAKFVGAKYALATFCGSAGLHLSMTVLGLKPGDEVIVPEITWVACANAVAQTGATPVFVDVEEDSWTIDPDSLRKAINANTKAIMPVHSYGHPADMDPINAIAKEHDLYVVEDAAPSVGSKYLGRSTGTLSDMGVFSFQGAKIMVTGEGGMWVTNSDEFYERAKSLAWHGRDDSQGMFYSKEVGYKYTMGNILAALGLAQLERVEELVKNKRRIHDQYESRFKDIPGIKMFKEKENYYSNCSYPSILLNDKFKIGRDELLAELKIRNIDTRPVFPRLSKLPSFEQRFVNPVAGFVEKNALNLPCPHNLTEEEVNRTVNTIKEILCC